MSDKYKLITPDDIYKNEAVHAYIKAGNQNLGAIGLTEHGFAHAKRSSNYARDILKELDYPQRTCELAAIAGYMHDIGNVINRSDHAHSGAMMAFQVLNNLQMPPDEIAIICAAIGHHDEKTAYPVNEVAAALILSDKTDVRRTRVRHDAVIDVDIHDRVNYAVEKASFDIDAKQKICIFDITIATDICPVMEYFEIFLERMVLCRKAAQYFDLQFELVINHTRLL
ncbi:HD domain-containing protein [Scatolibacter rhodanostii]|uniref:HD domain-containing protein n=1 Tax=Scatolibacter rhodanostii TaxID=2014781 RepID=UPI000C08ACC7|nr:HD domain-containing protein [Scatolibacter rhodanostii]